MRYQHHYFLVDHTARHEFESRRACNLLLIILSKTNNIYDSVNIFLNKSINRWLNGTHYLNDRPICDPITKQLINYEMKMKYLCKTFIEEILNLYLNNSKWTKLMPGLCKTWKLKFKQCKRKCFPHGQFQKNYC